MVLNQNQRDAVQRGEAVRVLIGQTQCVIMRHDVYEKSQDSWAVSETYEAVEAALDQLADSEMRALQH